jgi:phosphohistidine phosphatase
MKLYILRHGIAVERGAGSYAKDSDRPLTPKGERKLWKIAEAMEALGIKFDLILSSPYTRARQTAEIVAKAFNTRKKLEFTDNLTPAGSFKKLVDFIKDLSSSPKSILLVGHEPYLSQFISLLVGGDQALSITLKKGGLCKLSSQSLKAGHCATLDWLMTPKQMALME